MSKKSGAMILTLPLPYRFHSRGPHSSLCRLEFTSVCRWGYLSDSFFFAGLIGRIWSIICKCQRPFTCIPILTTVSTLGYNRYETHYGQEQSRLSRDCAILSDDSTEVQWTRTLLSLLSFRTSDRYLEKLDALFVDRFVYAHAWTTFMSTCLKTWRRDCCASAMLLLFVNQIDSSKPTS